MYADDTQVYGFCRPTAATALTANITDCVETATSWMRSNRLQSNPDGRSHTTVPVMCDRPTTTTANVTGAAPIPGGGLCRSGQ